MSEVQALHKLPCQQCGGDLTWDAARQALACSYCGSIPTPEEIETASAAGRRERAGTPLAGGPRLLIEHDLEEGLRQYASRKGEEKERHVRCENCQAITRFDARRTAQRCDFCGSPSIIPAEEDAGITPDGVLPVTLSEGEVRDRLREWYKSRSFAPNRLKKAALTDTLHGLYLPYWTFDAHAHGDWTAESGYYYYETEYYRDSQGHRRSRRVRRVRWSSSEGTVNHFFDDDLVPGTKATWYQRLRQIEPFYIREIKPYDDAYVRGWVVERYQRDLHEAEVMNREQMESALYKMCGSQVPGDTYRNLRVDARFTARSYKLILVPVWIVSYDYGRRSFQVIVNGSTGAISGERPYSVPKIVFAILFWLGVAALIVLWLSNQT